MCLYNIRSHYKRINKQNPPIPTNEHVSVNIFYVYAPVP